MRGPGPGRARAGKVKAAQDRVSKTEGEGAAGVQRRKHRKPRRILPGKNMMFAKESMFTN